LSAGGAPGFVSGLIELHVRVPGTLAAGDTVALEFLVGGTSSQPGLAVSVK